MSRKKKRREEMEKDGDSKSMAELTKDHDLSLEDQKEDGKESFDSLLEKAVPKTTPKKK